MNQNEMSLNDYAEKTKEWMELYLGGTYTVWLEDIPKNNGLKRKGMIVKDNIHNMSPIIYLDGYYERLQNGEDMEELFEDIKGIYEAAKVHTAFDMKRICCYEETEKDICVSLINAERNKELLKDVPNVPIYDLVAVFYIMTDMEENGLPSRILVNSALQERWGVTAEELYETALRNTERMMPAKVTCVEEELIKNVCQMMGEENEEVIKMFFRRIPTDMQLYIASNPVLVNGAGVILYKNFLKNFAGRMDSDVYILPSSINEVILLPAAVGMEAEDLKRMVSEVNREAVHPEEVLSDHVYFYSRKTDRVEML